ncbi:unnamed protein product [Microthlaspi erraticum]|uniref:Uncharacterized protein n=1 Tax=Microthlaspi erraticum TaxID=1685480 RepID=A0A6D2L948_9BRAS|nr:unnamed protein product [Microthlaspi erraticum]
MVKKIYHKKNVHSWRDLDGRAEPLHARPCPLKPPNTPSHLIPSASHPSHLTTLAFHHYHHSTAFTILQTAISRISAERADRLAEERCSALGQNRIRPTDVSAKVQTIGRSRRPGKHCPAVGQANATPPAHDQAREPGNKASRPRNLRVPRPMHPSEPGRRPTSGRETIGQIFIRRPSRPTVKSSGHDRSDSTKDPTVRPTVPTTVRTPRSTRSRF